MRGGTTFPEEQPHIPAHKDADGIGASVFADRSGVIPRGAMWTSPSTVQTVIFDYSAVPSCPESP